MKTVQAILRDRPVVVAASCEVADTDWTRLVGLLGRDSLAESAGLWIVPCNSVHTWFMRFPVDLVFLDREQTVVRIAAETPPFRVRVTRTARSVLELAASRAATVGLTVGDRVEFAPRPDG